MRPKKDGSRMHKMHFIGGLKTKGILGGSRTEGSLYPKADGRDFYSKLGKEGLWPTEMCLASLKTSDKSSQDVNGQHTMLG
jgi:hypothetical protein